jgi:hypothetical protein
MTFSLYSAPDPEPIPERPAPSGTRRLWIIIGTVVAVLLFGASATYLLVNASISPNGGTPPGAYSPPPGIDPTDPPTDQASASLSASASASPSASRASASPGRTGPVVPTGPGVPATVNYRIADNLCHSVDLTELKSAAGQPTGGPLDAQGTKSNYTDYGCGVHNQTTGNVAIQVDAMIFGDATSASASFESDKIPGVEPVSGVGTQAIGSTGTVAFYLIVLDRNLKFKVWVNTTSAAVRQSAINTAKATLPKLRG